MAEDSSIFYPSYKSPMIIKRRKRRPVPYNQKKYGTGLPPPRDFGEELSRLADKISEQEDYNIAKEENLNEDEQGRLTSFAMKEPILIIGDSGCGKTSLIDSFVMWDYFPGLTHCHIVAANDTYVKYKEIKDSLEYSYPGCIIDSCNKLEPDVMKRYVNKKGIENERHLFIIDDMDYQNSMAGEILTDCVNVYHSKGPFWIIITLHQPFHPDFINIRSAAGVICFFSGREFSKQKIFLNKYFSLEEAKMINNSLRANDTKTYKFDRCYIIRLPPSMEPKIYWPTGHGVGILKSNN